MVKGAIVDGSKVWQNRAAVDAIKDGKAGGAISLPVALVDTPIPVPSTAPTPAPSPSAPPSAALIGSHRGAQRGSERRTERHACREHHGGPDPDGHPDPEPDSNPQPDPDPDADPDRRADAQPNPDPDLTPVPTLTPTAVPSGAPTPTPITAVTGTLTYRELYQRRATRSPSPSSAAPPGRRRTSVVASTIDRDITSAPVDFDLDLAGATIDPNATYTVQATIVDGENAWVTGKGVPVLTKGNPSNVDITLTYRPDLVKGAVSGQITGVGDTVDERLLRWPS